MKKLLLGAAVFICLSSAVSAEDAGGLDVIFIGNSGITYQQMHRTVERISSRPGFYRSRNHGPPALQGRFRLRLSPDED